MSKRTLFAGVAVFVLWAVLDFVQHGLILASSYEATAELWRPMEEMMDWMWLTYSVTLILALVFALIYSRYFGSKRMSDPLLYGFLWGLAFGISMGYGTYSVQPILYSMALVWFLAWIVKGVLGGWVLGMMVRA
jgi:hypothetical protein